MVMLLITGLNRELLILSVLVKVVGDTEDKEDHGFLETHLVVNPLHGVGVLIREVIKVSAFNHDESIRRKKVARKGY